MRTFVLAYDRQGDVDDRQKEIANTELLKELTEMLINEGADGVYHPVASTLVFTSHNRYIYNHWVNAINDYNQIGKIFFVLSEVYHGASRNMLVLSSTKINQTDFQAKVAELLTKRTGIPPLRV